MLAINMADVVNVLNTCKPYLIGFGIVLAIALIVLIAAFKLKKTKRKLCMKSYTVHKAVDRGIEPLFPP